MSRVAFALLPPYFPRTALETVGARVRAMPDLRDGLTPREYLHTLARNLVEEDRDLGAPPEERWQNARGKAPTANVVRDLHDLTELRHRAAPEEVFTASGVPYLGAPRSVTHAVRVSWWAAITLCVLRDAFNGTGGMAVTLYALRWDAAYREALMLCQSAGPMASMLYAERWLRERAIGELPAEALNPLQGP